MRRANLENIDGSGAEGKLREYLRPIHELAKRGGAQGLLRYDDGVAGIQTKLLKSVLPPAIEYP